jgi:hypothetical protein
MLIICVPALTPYKWKDYRIEGPARYKSMTLPTHEFIRRFLMHYATRAGSIALRLALTSAALAG